MRIFSPLYERVMRWSAHPRAVWYLGGLGFAESSFFPIPPDVMLAPMTLARPTAWVRYATVVTLLSVLGGLLGMLIGMFAIETIEPLLHEYGYWPGYLKARAWFVEWGFWAVFLAGFSPIPYKVFTISAGALGMSVPLFLVASLIGRGGRFFLVAGLVRWLGPPFESRLRRHVDVIGWACVLLAVAAYVIIRNS